jgi:hypothetical protein
MRVHKQKHSRAGWFPDEVENLSNCEYMTDKTIFKIAVVGFLIITSTLAVMLVLAGVLQATFGCNTGGISAVAGGVSFRFTRWMSVGIVISIILIYRIVSRRRLR